MNGNGTPIDDLLAEARDHVRLPVDLDVSGRIAAANLAYGMARLLSAVRTVAPQGRVVFTASPDFTITRTVKRWQKGYAYGGLFELEPAGLELAIPELRPNACGTLVGRLEKPLTAEAMIRRASRVRAESTDPVWDYSRRNHFIHLSLHRGGKSPDGDEQIFIVHGCPARIRFDSEAGPGLDGLKSAYWRTRTEAIVTPLGEVTVLTGPDARFFWENFRRCEALSMQDRLETAERIFGRFEIIRNASHVGMSTPSSYYHGCHVDCGPDERYPVLTRPDAPAYLVTAGGADRPAILPHGTGYHLDLPESLELVADASGNRPVFVMHDSASPGVQAYGDFASVPFSYRDPGLVALWEKQGLLVIRDTLDIVATVKL